ncbi:MAG: hypothetical protein IJ880_08690 [Bacilli bacterium]|nr:hypothetical protein [Bacilli bacterium]
MPNVSSSGRTGINIIYYDHSDRDETTIAGELQTHFDCNPSAKSFTIHKAQ